MRDPHFCGYRPYPEIGFPASMSLRIDTLPRCLAFGNELASR